MALAAGAGLRYPGGTLLTSSSPGYSLTHNFLSDLGMTVAYNGRANMLGAAFFALSLLTLVLVFGRSALALVRRYRAIPAAHAWAGAAAVLVALTCIGFGAVAVTPENHVMGLHVNVTMVAWWAFAGATFLLMMASVYADSQARRRTVAWGILAVAVWTYVLYLTFGPSVTVLEGLRAQVLAQKVITVTAFSVLTYLSVEQRWDLAR